MNDSIFAEFPPAEQEQRQKINALMEDWKQALAGVQVQSGADGKSCAGSEFFCPDGFYPYYYRQNRKILFIGRESVDIAGCDYIALLLNAYRENSVAGRSLNQWGNNFSKRLLQIAWGILQGGTVPYEQVPPAGDLGKTFGTPEGISFAFMNLSKYSNESASGTSRRDAKLITAFLNDSRLEKRNFVREELAILDPDVVVVMNLWEMGVDRALVDLALGKIFECDEPPDFIEINGKKVPLINLCHFSARGSTEEDFYKPVMKIITDLARRDTH